MPEKFGYWLFVHNKDSKGRPKAYGQWHPTKKSAEIHRKNLRKYYRNKPKDLMGTRLIDAKTTPKRLSSKQIIARYFGKKKRK